MKDYILRDGTKVNEYEMQCIKVFYEIQCTAEELVENYNIEENMAEKLAKNVREHMMEYNVTDKVAIDYILIKNKIEV